MGNGDSVVKNYLEAERQPGQEPDVRITGLMVQYYHVCERELWFMSRGVDIDRETINIQRGARVDETSYSESRQSFSIGNRIQLDVLDSGDVMEVKVSSKLELPARMQLLFYLWFLREVYDVHKDGILAYPTERKRESVELTQANVERVRDTVRGILRVVKQDNPPELEKKPYCESCLYQDICWV